MNRKAAPNNAPAKQEFGGSRSIDTYRPRSSGSFHKFVMLHISQRQPPDEDKERPSHPQQAHLPPQRTRRTTILLAPIEPRIRIDIPLLLLLLFHPTLALPIPPLLHRAARVPPQRAAHAVEPLGARARDGRERVLRRRDRHVVALAQLHAPLAVEGAVGGGARVLGDRDA